MVGFGINNPTNSDASCGIAQVCFSCSSLDCPDIDFNGDVKEMGNVGGNTSAGTTTEMKINTLKH